MNTESKAFFSEEKKQKTFPNSGVGAAGLVRDSINQKSFGSFLQKRTSSFLGRTQGGLVSKP
jgi:hypothetical protein